MDHLTSLVVFVAAAAFTPGPNNIMILSSGLNFGWRASMPHVLGICFGVPAVLLVLGVGAGVLFERFPWLHQCIKVLGITYLLYLAYRIATSGAVRTTGSKPKPLSFLQSIAFQWVNPKTWMMGSSALATYTTVGTPMAPQIATIVLVFFIMTWPSVALWLFGGAALKKVVANPYSQRIFNWTMAGLLIYSMHGVILELWQDLSIWMASAR